MTKYTFEELKTMISSVNSYNGAFDNIIAYYHDEEFYNIYYYNNPEELARSIYYGGCYNYNHEYIRFNGYGNIETLDLYDYDDELQEYSKEIEKEYKRLVEYGDIEDYDNILKNEEKQY